MTSEQLDNIIIHYVQHLPVNGHTNGTVLIINVIIRHGEKPISLLRINLFDTPSHGVYHIEMNHSLA